MKLISWKYWLSYFIDVQVDYRSSEINGDLIVLLSKGKYQLCTENAIYSYEDRYDNFANIFKAYINLEQIEAGNTLILGLGMGSIPIILDQLRPGKWSFTAVEVDEAVCELAALYGYPKIISPIDTHIVDAGLFVQTCTEEFNLVCIDLFIDDVVPEEFNSIEFLRDLMSCLSPQNLVIANTLAYSQAHKERSKKYFEEVFKVAFPNAALISTHLNFMLISNKKYLLPQHRP